MDCVQPLGRLRARPLSTREPTKRKFDFAIKEKPPQEQEKSPDYNAVENSSKRKSARLEKKMASVSINPDIGSMTLMPCRTQDSSVGQETANSAMSKAKKIHPNSKSLLQRTPQGILKDRSCTSSAHKVPHAELQNPNSSSLNLSNPENNSSGTENHKLGAMAKTQSRSRGSQSQFIQPAPSDGDEDDNDGNSDDDGGHEDDGDREGDNSRDEDGGGGRDKEDDDDADENDREDDPADVRERLMDNKRSKVDLSQEAEISEGEGAESDGALTSRGQSSKKAPVSDQAADDEGVEDEEVDHSNGKIAEAQVAQKLGPILQTPRRYSHKSLTQPPESGLARRSRVAQQQQQQQPHSLVKRRSQRTQDLSSSERNASLIKLRTVRVCVGDRNRGVRKLTYFDVILTYLHNVLASFMEEVTSEECVSILQDLHKNLQVEFEGLFRKDQESKRMNSKLRRVQIDLVKTRKKRLGMRMEKERLRLEAVELEASHNPALDLSDAATTLEALSEFYKTQLETRGQRRHGEEEDEVEEPPSSVSSLLVDAHLVLSGAANLASVNTRLADKLRTHSSPPFLHSDVTADDESAVSEA